MIIICELETGARHDVGLDAQRDVAMLSRWCEGLPTRAHVEVLCAKSAPIQGPRHHQVVRLTGCLADVGAADLAELAVAASSVVLRVDGCSHGAAGRAARDVATILVSLGAADRLQVWDRVPDGVQMVPDRAEHGVRALPAPRRALFAWALPERSGPQQVLERPAHRRLVDALRALLDGAQVGSAAHALPSDALDLRSSGCTACGTCVRACPTGVLTLRESRHGTSRHGTSRHGTSRQLALDLPGCLGCSDCLTLCPAGALRSAGPISWGRLLEGPDELVLQDMVTRTCRRCRAEFAGGPSDRDLCPVCTDRRANPFGSMVQPRDAAAQRHRSPGTARF